MKDVLRLGVFVTDDFVFGLALLFDQNNIAAVGHKTFKQTQRVLVDVKKWLFLWQSGNGRRELISDAVTDFAIPQLVVNDDRNGIELARCVNRLIFTAI